MDAEELARTADNNNIELSVSRQRVGVLIYGCLCAMNSEKDQRGEGCERLHGGKDRES